MDERMVRLWECVFNQPVAREQDFFLDLGGNSVQALELVDAVVSEFDVSVSVADLFDHSTPAALTAAVAKLMAAGSVE